MAKTDSAAKINLPLSEPRWPEKLGIENYLPFVPKEPLYFGNRVIPVGSWCRLISTQNAGFVAWTESNGVSHLASDLPGRLGI